jgi:dTDP-4-amino-4,6-dideoxygalactose transaminase
MKDHNFSPWPSHTNEEAAVISDVLLSNKVNYWSSNEALKFEKEFAKWVGSKYAVAVSNGTVALELSLKSLGISSFDEVIVTSRTYFASVSAIISVGATPVFADVDYESQNITIETIKSVLSEKTKAILCVHLAGFPCDMDPIIQLAKQNDLLVIEDCAQAHGARYKDKSVGCLGDIGCWSFCQDKIITTGGEGGMVTTNSLDLRSKVWSYKDHGKSMEHAYKKDHTIDSEFKWLHYSFGTNARITEMQAAIGRVQLKHMDVWHKKRVSNMKKILGAAKECIGLRVPEIPDYVEHAAYKCYVFVKPNDLMTGWDRGKILKKINELGVPCYTGSCPEVYLEECFDKTNFRPKRRMPNAKKLGETSLMFLVHPTLTNSEIRKTCSVIIRVMKMAVTTPNKT